MKKSTLALIIVSLVILFVAIFYITNSFNMSNIVTQNQTIKIGIQTGPASTLLMVAKDKGFFEEEGIDVDLVEFTAGKLALQAFLAGSLDLAASGEVPITLSSLQGNKFYIITQVVESTKNEVRVVALRDDGLNNPSDYFNSKKRKLATSFGGGPEFYTYNFLKKYNITNVELISQNPQDMPVALESHSVDAIAIFEPHATFAEQKLGNKSITFKDEELYSELYVLSAKEDWVNKNPDKTEKILIALFKASDFIQTNPEESKNILIKYTKLDKQTVDNIWGSFVYKPVLNKLLLRYLSDEAQWAKETNKVSADVKIPDFKNYIYEDGLKKIKPEYVTI